MSICSSLNDETAKCRKLEIYDDDEFSLAWVVLTNGVLFFVGLMVLALLFNWLAKKRYKKKL